MTIYILNSDTHHPLPIGTRVVYREQLSEDTTTFNDAERDELGSPLATVVLNDNSRPEFVTAFQAWEKSEKESEKEIAQELKLDSDALWPKGEGRPDPPDFEYILQFDDDELPCPGQEYFVKEAL